MTPYAVSLLLLDPPRTQAQPLPDITAEISDVLFDPATNTSAGDVAEGCAAATSGIAPVPHAEAPLPTGRCAGSAVPAVRHLLILAWARRNPRRWAACESAARMSVCRDPVGKPRIARRDDVYRIDRAPRPG